MNPRNFIPKGAASFAIEYDGPSKEIYFLLLPKLTMLAFSAAVEPLRIANQVTNKELYKWYLISEDGNPVRCSNGVKITPDLDLHTLPRSSRLFVCSGIEPSESSNSKILSWISRQKAFGCKLGGICTGAFTLAKAGALIGKKFTLHWENQPAFVEHFEDLKPSANLYEIDNDLMTCGGGNAATDMMLDMIETDFGKDLAIIVSDMCIHFRSNNRKTLQKSAFSVALGSRNQYLINAMQIMHENLEDPLDISEIAEIVQISRRQLERLFQKYVETSPVQFYIELRVARAYALLSETEMTVAEIAAATGFGSATQLTVRFKKRYGEAPTSFRRGWTRQKS
ncbi:AraC family transcriptional regulator [Ruegeria sp. ANG-R]|uniref:GlxA family transcriptional regulator n=1 Tax=Ruegeria sp. ANG-R TaxID=1577903 RepID=UPI00057F77BE|nr:GlxA family transcriptional regulator [Ruegeria sp. ANG-R]KIC39077.1 AraC family transcriptional regulator [Ruegeria sp. ANG-R]